MAHTHQVFQNSYLTIVATNASSSEQGFLEAYDNRSTVISLPLRLEDGRIGNILLSQKGTELNREPPHERAWTLPETVPAPRFLVYGRKCVFWKCVSSEDVDVSSMNDPSYP